MRNHRLSIHLCTLVVLALTGVCAAQQATRTYTYGIEINGELCGYADVDVSTVQEDGATYLLLEQKTIVSAILLGMDVDQQIELMFRVDPATGQYTESSIHIRSDTVELQRQTRIEGDTAYCTSTLLDGENEVKLPPEVDLQNNVYLTRARRDFVDGGMQEQSYLVLDAEHVAQPLQTVTFTKTGNEMLETPVGTFEVFIVETVNKVTGAKSKLWLSVKDGMVIRAAMPNGTEVYLADADVKDRIQRVNVDDTILAKANTDITDIHGITYMKVKASMEPVGAWLEHDSVNVRGQRFEGTIENNRLEGVFEIEHAHYDGTDAPPYPPDFSADEALAKYLRANGLIESDDPVLIEKAREIAEGSADSWEAAVRLSRWVADNIGYEIPGGVFARKVYDMRVGECGGHSVLLAAFCRAVGIPARGVWGCMYAPMGGGSFGQHAWTEIYMGEAGWIPVDSTAHENDFVDSGHIRLGIFGDGGSTRIALGAKSMEVLDYRVRSDSAGPADASVAGKYVAYVGAYETPDGREPFQVLVKDGRLAVRVPGQVTLPLNDPDENGIWMCTLTNLVYCTFEHDASGQVASMDLHEIVRMRRKSDPDALPDDVPEHLREYLGGYFLPQLNGEVELVWDEGQIGLINPAREGIRHLSPADEEGVWTIEEGRKVISFLLDADGTVISMSVDVRSTFPRQPADS